jgi:beta-lactamase class A
VLLALGLAPVLLLAGPREGRATAEAGDAAKPRGNRFLRELAALERRAGGRLGVAAWSAAGGVAAGHRGDERFLFCSTFKALLAGFVLRRVDLGLERLDRAIPVRASDIVSHSPVAEKAVGGTLGVGALCHATVTVSDNAAANLLFDAVGGPKALTAFLRELGDAVTRSDRRETALNLWSTTDRNEDTTTPSAMAASLGKLLHGPMLGATSRAQLRDWLRATTTGAARIRAGLPADWIAGDKTGTGPTSTNDVAWIEGPAGGPWALAVYYADAPGDIAAQNAVIADVARAFSAFVVESPARST